MQHKQHIQLRKIALALFITQIIIIIFYGIFLQINHDITLTYLSSYYPWLQDITVMMLIGFGYLMTIIKTTAWSALGFTFLINTLVAQIYILTRAFWQRAYSDGFQHQTIKITILSLMQCSFAVASCLIAFGAVIGRVGPYQLFIMSLIQVFGYSLNQEIVYKKPFKVIDYGGSMSIHTFGAIYGLVVSYIIGRKKQLEQKNPSTDYLSAIYSFLGSLFLWLFWPSFNSGSIPAQYSYMRLNAIINTLLALTGSCLMSFAASIYIRGKIAADDILNATLSGGVIVGASCSIITNPAGAIAIGMISGFTSTTGFSKLASIFTNYGIYDSVGVAHLHAIPGILGGLVSAIFIAAYNITTPEVGNARTDFAGIDYMRQGGMQILATLISIGLAIAFGLIAGLLMNCVYQLQSGDFFQDQNYWETGQGYLGFKIQPKIQLQQYGTIEVLQQKKDNI